MSVKIILHQFFFLKIHLLCFKTKQNKKQKPKKCKDTPKKKIYKIKQNKIKMKNDINLIASASFFVCKILFGCLHLCTIIKIFTTNLVNTAKFSPKMFIIIFYRPWWLLLDKIFFSYFMMCFFFSFYYSLLNYLIEDTESQENENINKKKETIAKKTRILIQHTNYSVYKRGINPKMCPILLLNDHQFLQFVVCINISISFPHL